MGEMQVTTEDTEEHGGEGGKGKRRKGEWKTH
jgi:hypothetical protein